jgi:DGQHR domain-containing protein
VFQIPIPVIVGKHSDRLFVAQTVSPLGNIQALLGHDPRSPWKTVSEEIRSVYEKIQRKTDKERKTKLQSYLIDRMVQRKSLVGGLPAIAIGVQNSQVYKPHNPDDPSQKEAGTLLLDTDPNNRRILFDGLGRVSTWMDALEDKTIPQDVRERLKNLYIPVTLYLPHAGAEPLSIAELGQMFHDFNVLASPVGKGMAIDLDKSDTYVQLVERLQLAPAIVNNGGIDSRGSSTPRKNALMTKMTLVKMVRAAIEGPGSHVDHYTDAVVKPRLEYSNMQEHVVRLTDYLSTIENQMGASWADHECIHLSTPGLIALGLVYFDLHHGKLSVNLDEAGRKSFIQKIGQIDWSLGNSDFAKFLGTPITDKETGQPVVSEKSGHQVLRMYGGSKAFYNLAGYIRHKIGLTGLLVEQQFGNPENFDILLKAA